MTENEEQAFTHIQNQFIQAASDFGLAKRSTGDPSHSYLAEGLVKMAGGLQGLTSHIQNLQLTLDHISETSAE